MKLAILLIIYISVCALIPFLLYQPVAAVLKKKAAVLIIAVVMMLMAFPVAGALLPDNTIGFFFQRWGNIILGYAMFFFVPLLLLTLVKVIIRWVKNGWEPSAKLTGICLAGLCCLTIAVNVGGTFVAHDVKVTHYEVDKAKLGQTEPLRIVLIADLHIGVNSIPKLYQDMVDRINEQDADLVLIAGDIVTSTYNGMGDPKTYSDILSKINAKYGKYAVYGNHDVDEPLFGGFTFSDAKDVYRNPHMDEFMADCGWTLLQDQIITVPGLDNMVIAGRRDQHRPGDGIEERKNLDQLLAGETRPVLLLEHEPEEMDIFEKYGIGLAVCGHTHDGQIFPGNLYVRLFSRQSYGKKEWGENVTVVTSGVGYFGPPIRVGTISEIVVIDLR